MDPKHYKMKKYARENVAELKWSMARKKTTGGINK